MIKLLRLTTPEGANNIEFNGLIKDDLILKKGSSIAYASCAFENANEHKK